MVFDGYCIVFMIDGDILSFKNILFLFIKSLIYSIPNKWFLLACQQKIKKNGGF